MSSPAEPSISAPDRLRVLVDTGIALSSELSLPALLEQLIESAARLTGARYGALGVIDRSGTGLEQFITVGVDAETRAAIGDLPHGRGILGVLIRDREPLRLTDIAQDPRSVGLPARPSAHAFVPRRPDQAARNRVREPVPDREGGCGSVLRRRRGGRQAAGRPGRCRDRERAPVRVGAAVVAAARVAERGVGGAADRGRPHRAAQPRGRAAPGAARRARRPDRAPDGRRRRPHRRGGDRRERLGAARPPPRHGRARRAGAL